MKTSLRTLAADVRAMNAMRRHRGQFHLKAAPGSPDPATRFDWACSLGQTTSWHYAAEPSTALLAALAAEGDDRKKEVGAIVELPPAVTQEALVLAMSVMAAAPQDQTILLAELGRLLLRWLFDFEVEPPAR